MIKKLTIVLCAAIAATGCVKEHLPGTTTLGIEGMVYAFGVESPGETRTAIETGTYLGVYALDREKGENASTALFRNIQYTVEGEHGAMTPEADIRLTLGKDYDVLLYAPYGQPAGDAAQVAFTHGQDVLWGKTELREIIANPVAQPTLSRLCSQLTFVVHHSDHNPIANAVIDVAGFFDGATLNVGTGVLTPSATSLSHITAAGTPACIFVPAAGVQNLTASITLPPNETYQVNLSHEFLAGVAHRVTLTLPVDSNTQVDVSVTVVPWAVGGEVDSEVQ